MFHISFFQMTCIYIYNLLVCRISEPSSVPYPSIVLNGEHSPEVLCRSAERVSDESLEVRRPIRIMFAV